MLWFSEMTSIHSITVDPILPRFSVLISQPPLCPSIYSPLNDEQTTNPYSLPENIRNSLNLPTRTPKTKFRAQKSIKPAKIHTEETDNDGAPLRKKKRSALPYGMF